MIKGLLQISLTAFSSAGFKITCLITPFTIPKFAINQSEVLISCDIRSLTIYGYNGCFYARDI